MAGILDILPSEILFKILSYLDTYDLMRFCVAYGNSSFLKDMLIRSVDLSRKFELQKLDLCAFITKNLNCAYINTLNINYLYWIPGPQLRTVIEQLENLEVLHALDTELQLKQEDLGKCLKLRKLAITVKNACYMPLEDCKILKSLKSLCFKMTNRHLEKFYQLFEEMQHLEELWVVLLKKQFVRGIFEEDNRYTTNYASIINSLTKLKKIVVKSDYDFAYYNFEDVSHSKIFERRRNGPTELIFAKCPSISKDAQSVTATEGNLVEVLKLFEVSPQDLPCGPEDTKKIYFNEPIENIYFKELNFCHVFIWCHLKYIEAIIQILSSKNSTKLRRLRIRSCVFQTSQTETSTEPGSGFKWLRKQTRKKPTTSHPFSAIAENFKNLRELEIESCPACNGDAGMSAYFSIQIFENLQKLTLEVPPQMEGLYLKEVFMKCQKLESLSVTCVVQNEKFISNMCQNLKYVTNLRDIRLDGKKIIIDRLLDSFLENKNLLRIFIKSDHFQFLHRTNLSKLFQSFIENNPQVIFFLIVTKDVNKEVDKVLDSLRSRNPAKVFYTESFGSLWHFRYTHPAHDDITADHTCISGINIDEF